MKIEHCEFPDDLLYDPEGLVWTRLLESGDVVVGITSIHAALAGPVAKVSAKPLAASYPQNAAIGFLTLHTMPDGSLACSRRISRRTVGSCVRQRTRTTASRNRLLRCESGASPHSLITRCLRLASSVPRSSRS